MPKDLQVRRSQMLRAAKWSAALFVGFLIVTQQVISFGPLANLDSTISNAKRRDFAPWVDFILRKIDDLGLRGQLGLRRQPDQFFGLQSE